MRDVWREGGIIIVNGGLGGASCVTHLAQRLELGLHDELVFAQLAAASVGALDPLLQTGLVDEAQAPRAVARCDQRALVISFAVTNPAGAREYSQRRAGGEAAVMVGDSRRQEGRGGSKGGEKERSKREKLAGKADRYFPKLEQT